MSTQFNDDELEPLVSPRSKKVWYKTASPYFLLPALAVLSANVGLGLAARVEFYLKVVCYEYYSSKEQSPPSLNPINDYPDEMCNNVEVQAITSQFIMIVTLCSAIPAIFALGPLGSFSDRKGRKVILLMSITGSIISTSFVLLVGNFLETLGLYPLLIGSLIDGFTGGFYLLNTASFAYIADCSPPAQRSVIFGWMQGSFFAGIAIGPVIGGWIVEATNNLLSVFYVIIVINFIVFLFFLFILPESLTKEKLLENLKLYQESLSSDRSMFLNNTLLNCFYKIFKPLTIFFPSNSIVKDNDKFKTKYSLLLLTIVSTLISAAITGMQAVFLLYTSLVFNWSLVEQGYFIFLMGISRVFVLFVLFPAFVSNFKRYVLLKNVIDDDEKSRKEFIFEIWILRLSLVIDAIAYSGYGLATSGSVFIGASLTAALGCAAAPTIKSLQTNLVAPSQIGQLLGALSVLDSVIRIIAPIIFNTSYAILVKTSPNLIWYGVTFSLAVACLFSFCVTPNKVL